MKKYFVVDLNTGQKYGPADIATLNQWLAEGRVTPQSTLEDAETGERIIANAVPGLNIGPTAPTAPPNVGEFHSPYPRANVHGTAFGQYPPGIYFEFIGKSWEYIKANLGLWIAAGIIFYMVAGIVSYPISFLAQFAGAGSLFGEITNWPAYISIQALGYIIQIALIGPLSAGMVSFALDQIDGKPADISALFRPFKNFGQNILGSLAYYFAVIIGFFCCIVPGIYLVGRLAFVNIIITEENLTAQDAIKKSWDTMGPFAWAMFGIYFVASIVSSLGLFACCVGVVVTIPFLYLTLAQQYRVLFPAQPVNPTGHIG